MSDFKLNKKVFMCVLLVVVLILLSSFYFLLSIKLNINEDLEASVAKSDSNSSSYKATGYLANPINPSDTKKDFMEVSDAKCFPYYCETKEAHSGIDLYPRDGAEENTKVYAMDSGVVSAVGNYDKNCYPCSSNGIGVVIDHGNGYQTEYWHLSKRIVNKGDKVRKGQLIGYVGNTGNSRGTHLHITLKNKKLYSKYGYSKAKGYDDRGFMNAAKYINKKVSYVEEDITLTYNYTYKKKLNDLPSNIKEEEIIWSSTDTSLVNVDKTGTIKTKSGKVGNAYVVARTSDGSYKKRIKVHVIPNGNPLEFNTTYTPYKSNILLARQQAGMQSFAIYDNYIYLTQAQSIDPQSKKTVNESTLSKVELKAIKNGSNTTPFTKNTAFLKDFGHVANIDIERTNNVVYLWTGCSRDDDKDNKSICRIKLNSIKYGEAKAKNKEILDLTSLSALKIKGANLVSVDAGNRTLVTMTGSRTNQIFTVYNLDDYIEYGKKHGVVDPENDINARNIVMFSFKIKQKKKMNRQGFEVYGKYIYSYEGDENAAYISVFGLNGEVMVYRKKIEFPDSKYNWEPEGIKIYKKKIYVGFVRKNKVNSKKVIKSQYIYVLD